MNKNVTNTKYQAENGLSSSWNNNNNENTQQTEIYTGNNKTKTKTKTRNQSSNKTGRQEDRSGLMESLD